MDLVAEVLVVMQSSLSRARTIDDVAEAVAHNIKGDIRHILNALVDAGE